MSILHRLRVLETHQLPGTLGRLTGDAGLVAVGLLAWLALPLEGFALAAFVAGALMLLLASLLLVSGRNARLVRWRDELPATTPLRGVSPSLS